MSSVPRTLTLEVRNETTRRVPLGALRQVGRRARSVLSVPPRCHVTLVFTTDAAMRRLNRRTRGIGRPTDVLAFPLSRPRHWRRLPPDPDGVRRLGDVVISLDAARRQARAARWSVTRELSTLFAHGFLHLLGYDHQRPSDARRMARLTARLVAS